MLASLLPGLREVRVPLTVGYLWLLCGWVYWADDFPYTRPDGTGLIARLYDLSDFLGNTAAIASLSFGAYILGAMVTLPVRGRLAQSFFENVPMFLFLPKLLSHFEALAIRSEYDSFLRDIEIQHRRVAPPWDKEDLDVERARGVSSDMLALRLLTAGKTEVYGEYDRYAGEGAFRVNMVLPVIALGGVLAYRLSTWYLAPIAVGVALILLVQGSNRLAMSTATVQRAAVAKAFTHPLEELLARRERRGAGRGGRSGRGSRCGRERRAGSATDPGQGPAPRLVGPRPDTARLRPQPTRRTAGPTTSVDGRPRLGGRQEALWKRQQMGVPRDRP